MFGVIERAREMDFRRFQLVTQSVEQLQWGSRGRRTQPVQLAAAGPERATSDTRAATQDANPHGCALSCGLVWPASSRRRRSGAPVRSPDVLDHGREFKDTSLDVQQVHVLKSDDRSTVEYTLTDPAGCFAACTCRDAIQRRTCHHQVAWLIREFPVAPEHKDDVDRLLIRHLGTRLGCYDGCSYDDISPLVSALRGLAAPAASNGAASDGAASNGAANVMSP